MQVAAGNHGAHPIGGSLLGGCRREGMSLVAPCSFTEGTPVPRELLEVEKPAWGL